ncbi:hypothetical protein [Pasteurella bettyae]|uniref:DNA-binding protein n=1 Tax=Pasteurella bettyae CCUG 2042 TaxID=1095749 RepID=I3DKA1_9PAST|nr:hypothetical protein [Pasteurella bettyae]EIJ72144.1 hypothetical protein HMPREF1052_2057 [Pasteurella bettyae CCUG 2042]SSX47826.1 Uncharacterised protein [Pasteurella bettyae]SUB20790.1 Uncharacterised protein [Pasteurella bettyae]
MEQYQEIMEKLTTLEQMLARQAINENNKELWNMEQVARYFRCTKRHLMSIITDPYFPRPVRMPTQRDVKKSSNERLFFVGEIVKYAQRRQERWH